MASCVGVSSWAQLQDFSAASCLIFSQTFFVFSLISRPFSMALSRKFFMHGQLAMERAVAYAAMPPTKHSMLINFIIVLWFTPPHYLYQTFPATLFANLLKQDGTADAVYLRFGKFRAVGAGYAMHKHWRWVKSHAIATRKAHKTMPCHLPGSASIVHRPSYIVHQAASRRLCP